MAITFLNEIALTGLSTQSSEATALVINGSNVVGTRELGSNAFNSTTIPTNNNQLTNGAGYTTNTGTTTASNSQTFTNKAGNISQWTNNSGYITSLSGAVLTTTNQTVAGTKTFSSNAIFPGTDGGTEVGVWAQSSSYGFIGTANMTGLEYAMIFDGTNTFLSAGTGGSLKLRGPANDSSPQIVVTGTSVSVDNGSSVGQGTIRAKYNSSDNSAGITSTFTVRNGNNSASLTFVIKDGVVTSVTSSDRRLKKNIKLIGKSPSGINIYEFQYKAKYAQNYGTGKFQGVMSDEVPWRAVSVDKGGYDMVDYSMIDVEFKQL